ncbi:Sm ribonucleoprotein-like protein [Natrialba hulunbeirensis JCM 10989]|uniref:Sm ribonucleoprotein-like protein n=1 Tax=Natrialba hulunbeirensis JCM 10989 TaxID=1227493 RepID=M0A6D0_9EURY|nr:LSM domain-containing protein [Natrialba hulunbeirensis]ELY93911.1 Sm ribonucleoprotein-like protein [Natrialba hulunbeirensis JCM 10989]
MSGRPLDVLEASLGERVTVRLKSGDEFAGELAGYDQHMNLVLEVAADAADGADSDDEAETESPAVEPVEDTTIIRGDNVVSITP